MKPDVDSTQSIPHPVWENPRVHLQDDIWLLTIVAILIATGVPWLSGSFEVDVATAGWGLLALGGIHIAFTLLASPARPHGRWHDRALTLLDVVGVVLIGFIARDDVEHRVLSQAVGLLGVFNRRASGARP